MKSILLLHKSLTNRTSIKFCPQTQVTVPASRINTYKAASDGGIDGVDFNAVLIAVGLEELVNNNKNIRKSKITLEYIVSIHSNDKNL